MNSEGNGLAGTRDRRHIFRANRETGLRLRIREVHVTARCVDMLSCHTALCATYGYSNNLTIRML